MDKNKIAQLATQLTSKEDLLALLNRIKRDEMSEMGFDVSKFHPFSMRHLNYYCNPNHVFHRYRQFKIKKKSGGYRTITAPRSQSFMIMLQAVNDILKAMYTPSNYAMGFTEGRSIVSNAIVHKGQNYIFNIDLKDFFPSIEQWRVWKRLQQKPFEFPKEIANVLAGLCSMRQTRTSIDDTKIHENDKLYQYVLPQGAPTSPIITNMICDTLDRRLAGLAKRFGLQYTRYADDITFSSMHYVFEPNGEFRKELCRIITEQGFIINEDKTRLQRLGARQEVTGIIVSHKLNVTQKYVRDIRNILYIWDRYGYSVALSKFLPKYKAEKGHVKKGNPDLTNVIDGKLMYLKMVKGEEDSVYVRLHDKFQRLVGRESSADKTNSKGITYMETKPLLQFEKENNTQIEIVKREGKPRYGHFNIEGMDGDTKFYFAQVATISVKISEEDETKKERLAISNCRDAKGNQFWQIHYIDKVTIPPPSPVNIDELNYLLDQLLQT